MSIFEMAQKAGWNDGGDCIDIKAFAVLVAAQEREECAKVADTISDKYGWGHYGNEVDTADEIAAAIRARGTT